jgi:hypothetical protein
MWACENAVVRRRWVLLVLALIAIASATALYFVQRHRPPRSAEMLPPSDGMISVNVELLRTAGVFDRNHPVERDPEFEQFVRETGFDFERDLDEAAFAVHNPQNISRGDDYPRFSEVFVGRIDEKRCDAYLKKMSSSSEAYRDKAIYSIPHEGRTVRVAVLDEHTAAASNTESADAIHHMVDAWRGDGAPHELLGRFYGEIPLGSIAWFIGHVAPPIGSGQTGAGLTTPSWLRDIAAGSTVVASLRFVTKLELRVVANAGSDDDARRIAQNATSWLAVFRTLQQNMQTSGTDPDVKAAFDSIQIEQEPNRVVLRADVPAGVLKKIAAEPPPVAAPPAEPPKSAKPPKK